MSVSSQQRVPARRWLRRRYRIGSLLVMGFVVLAWGPVFGTAVVALLVALAIAWLLWRNDVESGRD